MPQTAAQTAAHSATRNIALYPWFKFLRSLTFWQAIWFLFFQDRLTAADAIMLYAIYDIGTIVLEVPSGYMSDRFGRRVTLIFSACSGLAGAIFLAMGDSFAAFAMAQVCLGASTAFASGTDSALLYESLNAAGREEEIEAQELKAWRFSFIALALSAVLGGAGYGVDHLLPFYAGSAAFACALAVTFSFRSLPRRTITAPEGAEILRLASLKTAFGIPVLNWLFGLGILMYMFSHVLYVFGQPFILQALSDTGFRGDAPLVSGLVTATMMGLSVAVSLYAPALRNLLGLSKVLLLAFALQIMLSAVLSLTGQAIVIAILFLRMIPDALSKPFIIARIQPLLNDEARATYISLQSFCGRLLFAGALFFTSRFASDTGTMPAAEIQQILGWYALAGLACLIILALTAPRLKIDNGTPNRGL